MILSLVNRSFFQHQTEGISMFYFNIVGILAILIILTLILIKVMNTRSLLSQEKDVAQGGPKSQIINISEAHGDLTTILLIGEVVITVGVHIGMNQATISAFRNIQTYNKLISAGTEERHHHPYRKCIELEKIREEIEKGVEHYSK